MNLFKRSDGFSLVEIMVSIGILGILAAGMVTMISQQNKQVQDLRGQASKDNLVNMVRMNAGNPMALLNTANNAATPLAVKNCILGTATCNAGVVTAFALRDAADTGFVTGDAATAGEVYYQKDGMLCPNAASFGTIRCPMRARTLFRASCDGINWAAGVCAFANKIQIIYYVEQPVLIAGTAPLRTVCNDPNAVAPVVCNAAPIILSVPLAGVRNGVFNKLGLWGSSTTLNSTSILANDVNNSQPCNAANLGMIRNAGNSGGNNFVNGVVATGELQVCGYRGGVPAWTWVAGNSDSSAGNVAAIPHMPNMYVCPVNATWPVGGCPSNYGAPCAGQIQSTNICVNAGCVTVASCVPLF